MDSLAMPAGSIGSECLWIAAGQPSDGMATLLSLAPMFLIFIIFYLIWFLPLRKRQKALDAMRANLDKGDKVITSGGLLGEVAKVEDQIVFLKLNEQTKVRIRRDAIAGFEETPDREGNRS
jgi:preprotein translocase subunit YajC